MLLIPNILLHLSCISTSSLRNGLNRQAAIVKAHAYVTTCIFGRLLRFRTNFGAAQSGSPHVYGLCAAVVIVATRWRPVVLQCDLSHAHHKQACKALRINNLCQMLPIAICRSDLTLVCSPVEVALLKSVYQVLPHKLCPAPFFSANSESNSKLQPFSQRSHFMTIGNWRHPPNRGGVQWLCQDIWPSIRRQVPDAELHIYGAYMSQGAQQYHRPVSACLTCCST